MENIRRMHSEIRSFFGIADKPTGAFQGSKPLEVVDEKGNLVCRHHFVIPNEVFEATQPGARPNSFTTTAVKEKLAAHLRSKGLEGRVDVSGVSLDYHVTVHQPVNPNGHRDLNAIAKQFAKIRAKQARVDKLAREIESHQDAVDERNARLAQNVTKSKR